MYKMLEIVGSSPESFSKAVQQAIGQLNQSQDKVSWFEVIEQRGALHNGQLKEFQVKLKVAVSIQPQKPPDNPKETHFCPTCHQATQEDHLCVPVSKKDKKCDWCGSLIVNERHLCQDKIKNLSYICNSCGRTAVQAEHLCHPQKIR